MKFNDYIKLEEVKKMRAFALENHVPIIKDEALIYLIERLKDRDVSNFLEVGSAIGYSAYSFNKLLNINHFETIELDEERYNLACYNTKTEQNIILHHDNALDIDESELECHEFDVIFIDAVKTKNILFVEKYKKLLKEDGIMIIDNVEGNGVIKQDFKEIKKNKRSIYHGLVKFWNYLENEQDEFKFDYAEVGDGLLFLERKI